MRILTTIASIVLIMHGLIHLMGTTAYLKLAEIKELPYKTTVLAGRWDLGVGWNYFVWRTVGIGCCRLHRCRHCTACWVELVAACSDRGDDLFTGADYTRLGNCLCRRCH